MTDRKMATQKIQSAIRAILFYEWDPIGVCGAAPEDEYDSCIEPVYRILTTSRSEGKLVAYLAKVEAEYMGLKRPTRQGKWRERLRRVAHKLLRLDNDHALARSKRFQKSVKDSYREYKRKGGVSLETLIAQTERELAHRARKKGAVRPSTGSG
jgi:exonuclease V gamma subunit